MARSALVLRIVAVGVVLASLAGCNGKALWLGRISPAADAGAEAATDSVPVDILADGLTGDAIADGGGICLRGQVNANEVLWIGDSWILNPGNQRTRLRDLARAAGAIGTNEDYASAAAAGAYMADVAKQYDDRVGGTTEIKVLLMDGGTFDTIMRGASEAIVTGVVGTFKDHLGKVYDDGTVQHVVYFLCPELANITGVAILRPLLKEACALSKVPCHFLDLQEVWVGHPEYTAAGDFFPSEAGANALAEEIWRIMQQNCVAQ
jgi:hypothetical protein